VLLGASCAGDSFANADPRVELARVASVGPLRYNGPPHGRRRDGRAKEDSVDEARSFAGGMLSLVNDAGLAIMCSLVHRTGLFDTMSERQLEGMPS